VVYGADIRDPLRPTPDAVISVPAQVPHAAVRVFLPVGMSNAN
jgi:hypothetical protein